MRTTFKALGVIAALLGVHQADAQQNVQLEDDLQQQADYQMPQLIQTDALVDDSIAANYNSTVSMETDAEVQPEASAEQKPKQKKKGVRLPVEPIIVEGEHPLTPFRRDKWAREQEAMKKKLESQPAPKVSEDERSIMQRMKDAVMGSSTKAGYNSKYALGESENTDPSEFYDQTLNLNNIINQIYRIPLYFGSEKSAHWMAVDTNWDLLMIKSTECVLFDWEEDKETETVCPGILYDTESSDDYDDLDETEPFEFKLTQTEVYASGYRFLDTLCLLSEDDDPDDDLCVSDYRMYDIQVQTGIVGVMEGLWGLPSGIAFNAAIPPYLYELFANDIISEQTFAIAFKGLGETTFMDIGEVYDENMSDDEDIVYFAASATRWSTTISGLQFGENDQRQFTLTPHAAIFDSNAATILVPESEWLTVINQLTRELEYDQYNIDEEVYTCTVDCNAALFYDMYFFLDNQWWAQVRAEDFILDLSPTQSGQTCIIAVTNTTTSNWVLGIPFLRGWYVTFDNANQRTGIVPYAGSPKKELYEGTQPTETLTLDEASNWATYGFIAAIVVVLGAYIGSVYIGG